MYSGVVLASYLKIVLLQFFPLILDHPGNQQIFKHDLFSHLAADYGKSPAQIVLRWILQKGVIANTMSTKPENIRANFDVMDFILSAPDMAKIDELARVNYRVVTSAKVPWAPNWD